MLPSSGYFKSIVCPYFKNGFCCRPHCHYKHEANKVVYIPTPLVKTIPVYKPTPIDKLKKLKTSQSLNSASSSQNNSESESDKLEVKTDGQKDDQNTDQNVAHNDLEKKTSKDNNELIPKRDLYDNALHKLVKNESKQSATSPKQNETKSQFSVEKEDLKKKIHGNKSGSKNSKKSKKQSRSNEQPKEDKGVKNIKKEKRQKDDKTEATMNVEKKSDVELKRKDTNKSDYPAIVSKKQRVAHQPPNENTSNLKVLPKKTPKLTPAQVMLNRFNNASKSADSETKLPSSTSNETSTTLGKKRIAHTSTLLQPTSTKVSSSKIVPTKLRPVMPLELGGKIPLILRKRYLNSIIDELLKFCTDDEAYERGLNEEKLVYLRSTSKNIYLNLAVNLIKKLRRECLSKKSDFDQNSDLKNGINQSSSPQNSSKDNYDSNGKAYVGNQVSHEWILNGPNAQNCSIIKSPIRSISDLSKAKTYELLCKYTLTSSQLVEHGYPLMKADSYGSVEISNLESKIKSHHSDINICCRCHKQYYTNELGVPTNTDPCVYHPGRLWSERFNHSVDKIYSCCKSEANSGGCCSAKYHVKDGSLRPCAFTGYVSTVQAPDHSCYAYSVYALDCEMCYTTFGLELTKVTVIDSSLKVAFETLVRPPNRIIDYNTKFSGIKEGDLDSVSTTLENVQESLLNIINSQTILIGHSLESDLKALKIVHERVIDTAVLFPHRRGLPYKRSLKNLMAEYLKSIIQDEVSGHDSREDATSCMKLVLWKLSQNLPKSI